MDNPKGLAEGENPSADNEDATSSRTKILIKSGGRRLYCFCGVIVLPFFDSTLEFLVCDNYDETNTSYLFIPILKAMGDIEDSVEEANLGGDDNDEEEEEEGEESPSFFPTKPTILIYSFLRQAFCCSGVLALPFLYPIFEFLGDEMIRDLPEYYGIGEFYCGGLIGFASGGIMLYLMGSKSTVVASNIFNLLLSIIAIFYYNDQKDEPFLIYVVGFVTQFATLSFCVFTAEIADNTFRAFFIGLWYISFTFGKRTYDDAYLKMKLSELFVYIPVVATCSTILSLSLPETPFSLALKSNPKRARRIFTWIRVGDSDAVECDLMLDKAQDITEQGGILKNILSRTFVICMMICFFFNIIQVRACDLHEVVAHDFYFSKLHLPKPKFQLQAKKFYKSIKNEMMKNKMLGCLIYQVLCFVIPRKIIYLVSVIFNILLVVPFILDPGDIELFTKTAPICTLAAHTGKAQSIHLFPIEIFPAILRPVGVPASLAFNKIFVFLRKYTMTRGHPPFHKHISWVPSIWIYFEYSVALIGVPFILLFMPETKGMNLYELEEVRMPFTGSSSLEDETTKGTEENTPEPAVES